MTDRLHPNMRQSHDIALRVLTLMGSKRPTASLVTPHVTTKAQYVQFLLRVRGWCLAVRMCLSKSAARSSMLRPGALAMTGRTAAQLPSARSSAVC